MKTFYLKIRDKFISSVREGVKKHEYRLATPDRRQIKIGDNIVLISNQDKNNFIRTTVKSTTIYKSWQDALQDNWQQDFKDIFSSMEDALKECYKFYPKSEIDKYGIIVFEIEPLYVDYCNTSVLLDTNIIIKRESENNISFEVTKLFNWFGKKSILTYIHSLTKNELSQYGNEAAKTAMLTKLNSYDVLPTFNCVEDEYFNHVISNYSQDKNSKTDNALLREVYDYNVGLLLTDDTIMLRKAEDLYIRERVLSSAELLTYFEATYPQNIEYKMLAVKLKTFGEIDLNSDFFDTLREDYGGKDFDDWFKKKVRKNEQAYVFEDTEGLKGFLYLKTEDEKENYSDITPSLSPKKRLKVGTFKIERTGFRLGERFLKIIFDNARQFKAEEIYVTLFKNKRDSVKYLKSIMEEWGFVEHGYKTNGETVLVKTLEVFNGENSPKFNYPLIKTDAKYFFLPIFPQYHTDLFPDMILKNENMHLYMENKAHRYALEKIYLSGAYNVRARKGDLVLIYRTGERHPKRYSSVITGIAIVEDIIKTNTADDCISICKNRSIFTEEDIRKKHSKYPTVIKLLDYMTFKYKITLNELYEHNIVEKDSGPRPFAYLSKEQFEIIYKLGMESQQ